MTKQAKELILRSDEKLTRKEKNYKFIRNFSKITIKGICEKLGIERQNIVAGTAKEEKIEKVKEELEREIAKLYL